MISALQHYLFCPRQCALIHVSREWAENVLTVQGQVLHERADTAGLESRGDIRVSRALSICSQRLRIRGRADIVEFRRDSGGVRVADWPDKWLPMPIEYKRGKPKQSHCDDVQLCAQALCLEEMLDCEIPEAALFYGQTRRRHRVSLNQDLRKIVSEAAAAIHEMIRLGNVPIVQRQPKCKNCSLLDICLPPQRKRSARRWLESALVAVHGDDANEANP